jgi:hypothetical protein
MTIRLRKSVAVLCITIAVFAVIVPAAVFDAPVALLTPVWMYEPPAAVDAIADDLRGGHEQLDVLLDPLISRGPPRPPIA